MSKTKSSSKAAKPAKADVLTKVKDAAIVKPAQQVKAKSKEIAKVVAGKEDKKSKKNRKVREPTPESSESEEDSASEEESDSSESSSSESEAEEVKKPATNGKANGIKSAKKITNDDSESDEDSGSESDASEEETPAANGTKKPTAASDSEDDSDASSDDGSDDEKTSAKPALSSKATKSAKADSDDSDDESDANSDSSEDDSDDEAEDEKPKVAKRKAEEETVPAAKKARTVESGNAQSANLFVGNLSWNIDDAWLREVFEVYGEVSRVQLMTDRATGRSKGFGYVEFVNAEDAAKAHAEKQGADLDGRAMNVDFANARPNNQERQDNRRKSYGDQPSEPSDTLFLGNLSFDVGQEAVTEAFAPHGTVLGIRLPTDRETGQPKGFGYVTFSSTEEAQAALEAMQGAYISNRPVRLDFSQPRPQNDGSPARGGFGGRGGGRGNFGGRGGRGGRGGFGGGRGGGGRGGRGGPRGGSTNRGGFGDFSGTKVNFD